MFKRPLTLTTANMPTKARTSLWGIDIVIAAHDEARLEFYPKKCFQLTQLILHTIDYKDGMPNDEFLKLIRLSLTIHETAAFENIPGYRFTETSPVFDFDTGLDQQKATLMIGNNHSAPVRVTGCFDGVVAS